MLLALQQGFFHTSSKHLQGMAGDERGILNLSGMVHGQEFPGFNKGAFDRRAVAANTYTLSSCQDSILAFQA
jgi:hypothetical protein